MTSIAAKKNNSAAGLFLVLLGSGVIFGAMWLVVAYNRVVETAHRLDATEKALYRTQAESAELKDRVFALFGNENLETFANEKHLIKDRQPEYIKLTELWGSASQ